MALIELQHVSKIYPLGNQRVTALDDVSLHVESGEFTVFAGPSGSGKTTVLNLVGCLDQPTTGSVMVEGRNVGQQTVRELADFRLRHIGFIFSYNFV